MVSLLLVIFTLLADIVRTTGALCEGLKIPGSIRCHISGEEAQKSNYPVLVSTINEVSSV